MGYKAIDETTVEQAIADFDDIRMGIEEQGVEVPADAPTSQYRAKIAEIQGGASDYSFDEVMTGSKWVDGKDVYRKVVFSTVVLPSAAGDVSIPAGIDNADKLIAIHGYTRNPTSGNVITLNCAVPKNPAESIGVTYVPFSDTIYIMVGINRSAYSETFVILEYTCTDR